MTVARVFGDLDRFLARQAVERGEQFVAARAALSQDDFRSLLTSLGVSESVVVDEMLLASDSHARAFAEFGEDRARVLIALPFEFRAPFLRTHDIGGMGVLELFSAVRVFVKLGADKITVARVGGVLA